MCVKINIILIPSNKEKIPIIFYHLNVGSYSASRTIPSHNQSSSSPYLSPKSSNMVHLLHLLLLRLPKDIFLIEFY